MEIDYELGASFKGKLLVLGFGLIGKGLIPLLLRHINLDCSKITIIDAENDGKEEIARKYNIRFRQVIITKGNYKNEILKHIGQDDLLINVSSHVSTIDLVVLCQEKRILYVDTALEGWVHDDMPDNSKNMSECCQFVRREQLKNMKNNQGKKATALIAHGANPGLISSLLKEALLKIAKDTGLEVKPSTRQEWASLAQNLGIKTIQISERDTQSTAIPKQNNEFINTWSIPAFHEELIAPSEVGWGTHEIDFPKDARRHQTLNQCAIYFTKPGCVVKARSWSPNSDVFIGNVISHEEVISIADYYTVLDHASSEHPLYRPTVFFVYHPCNDAVISIREMMANNYKLHQNHRQIVDEIQQGGRDELGVLIMGQKNGAFWYGSNLSVDRARGLAPFNNATSLQVASGILAGIAWVINNPRKGVTEPDETDFEQILSIAKPYLGEVFGTYTNWTPITGLKDEGFFCRNDINASDPWQFKNFRIE